MSATPIPAQASAPKASTFRFDLVAGLTAAAVVLPKAMAYATVAGLPVAVGLYTAFIPMAIYALLGTSRVLSVSSTTTIAILAGTQLGLAVPDGDPARLVTATATLTLLVGAALVAARLLKLGFVANFISTPVLTGFKAGIGLVIVLDQVPKLLGIHITKHGFFFDAVSVVNHMPETSTITLMVALATFAVLIAMERLWPHSPAPLVAVAGGIAAAWFLGLEKMGVSIVGLIPQGFPSLTLPDPALVERLLFGALGIALMSFTESIAAGRAFARSEDPPVSANRELLATGAANLGGALFGVMPAGGGTSQTAVVRAAGGQTQLASLVTAGTALATMLFLAPILGLMPNATLAAVVIVYSVGLIKPSEFLAIRSVRTMEFRWALVACIGVLLLGTLRGIVVAIIVSMIGLASQSAYPRVYVIGRKRGEDVLRPLSPEHGDDETFEGLLILRPEGRLFFLNAQAVGQQIQALVAKYQPRVLLLDMSRVSDIEDLGPADAGRRRAAHDRGRRRGVAGRVESRRACVGTKHRHRRAAWSRAHAVQRARGDRALPVAEGDRRKRGLKRVERRAEVALPVLARRAAGRLRLDENHQCLGHHTIMGHRLCSRRALHDGVQRIHVRHIHHQSHPLRVLRIHERPDVGDAKRSKQLLPLRRTQPMILTLCDVVISNDGRHVVSFVRCPGCLLVRMPGCYHNLSDGAGWRLQVAGPGVATATLMWGRASALQTSVRSSRPEGLPHMTTQVNRGFKPRYTRARFPTERTAARTSCDTPR